MWDAYDSHVIIKAVNTSDTPQALDITIKGLKKKEQLRGVKMITFHSDNPTAENTLDNPSLITPQEKEWTPEIGANLNLEIPAKTFNIYILSKDKK